MFHQGFLCGGLGFLEGFLEGGLGSFKGLPPSLKLKGSVWEGFVGCFKALEGLGWLGLENKP